MIYVWNDKKLARDLKANSVTEKEKVTYLLASILLAIAIALLNIGIAHFNAMHGITSPTFGHSSTLSYLYVAAVIGLLYKTNEKGDNVDTIERYVCLSLPVMIRTLALLPLLAIGIIIAAVIIILVGMAIDKDSLILPIMCLLMVSMGVYYYLRMNLLFKIASGQME